MNEKESSGVLTRKQKNSGNMLHNTKYDVQNHREITIDTTFIVHIK